MEAKESKMVDIDLASVNWNKLNIEQFHELEKTIQAKNKKIKASMPKVPRMSGETLIVLNKNTYKVKTVEAIRLKNLKSGKSKDKLIQKIISSYNPIQNL